MGESAKLLIVSGSKQGQSALKGILNEFGYENLSFADTNKDGEAFLIDNDCDLLIVNVPLADGSGMELAYKANDGKTGVILIVKSDLYERVYAEACEKGMLAISRPLVKKELKQAVRLMLVVSKRLKTFEAENKKLQTKLEEMKIISRAKCVLMEYLGMSEDQAHKYIERQAMDMRMSKGRVSLGILKTYEP